MRRWSNTAPATPPQAPAAKRRQPEYMTRVFIALGRNLEQPVRQLDRAVAALKHLRKTKWGAVSGFYRSPPLAGLQQPDYVNAVARLDTRLAPRLLLLALQGIETRLGRPRQHAHWASRIIDLDLLVYGGRRISQRDLIVPHYALAERDFVVIPLLDVAPDDLVIPGVGRLGTLRWKHKNHTLKTIRHARHS